ncbi:MAG TPA: hypothetical protein VHW05_04905 [Phenylobacterium sp.]|jgi:hypothetical protein|nr:hypothetical protein [Phenylobacterium sp.]
MTADLGKMKRRLAVMMAVSGGVFVAAVAGFLAYFQFGQSWGRWFAVAALAIGFLGQIGLVLSLRRDSRRA